MSITTHRRVALRRCLASIAAATIGLGGVVVGASVAHAAPSDVSSTPIDVSQFEDGRYVVTLVDDAAALYSGGVASLQATATEGDEQLDVGTDAVQAYTSYLADEQAAVAADVGAEVASSITVTNNAFIASLTAEQAATLATDARVASVHQDTMLHVDGSPSNEYLDVEGMWTQVGGLDVAGAGVVVGVIDTGIAPENPLFDGAALSTTPSTEPYLAEGEGGAQQIVYGKSDGATFTGTCQTGPQFTADMCSTKIVGAQFFVDGFDEGADLATDGTEVASPRDLDGHGSHTASTAAGNADVEVTTEGGQDIGTMSGVAPQARIAVYKACWTAVDPDQTGCALTDLLDAIEAATIDGVDVINFSIGGGAATSVIEPYDQSFLGAAAAGVFVSASAGNSGPTPTTLDHASPWYTTVANTTIPNYEATLTLQDGRAFPGASITVDMSEDAEPLTGTLVYAGDIPAAGVSPADAALCLFDAVTGAASIADVEPGTIVLCDRGVNARVDKSSAVEAAGGIGMVLGNPTPNSIDLDDHAVPTIHIDAQYYAAVKAAAQADPSQTVTFTAGNSTDDSVPAPIVAASSSRGPVEADGSDVIKPDVAAPGTGIIAAGPNAADGEPTFRFLSGTSMAAPHVAGLAAIYLSQDPEASPAEIKSALMTTATNTVNADGSQSEDWFAQGAGFVNTDAFLDAGVYYANGEEDWYGYLRGVGYVLPDSWVGEAMDPSDLNIASIGIGALPGEQTVTRTLTALEPGTYTVSIDAPAGVEAVVSPTQLDFTAAGQELSYTVTFTTTATAALEEWTTGSLTWTSAEHTARSPIAVRPVALAAPEWVEGEDADGEVSYDVTPGAAGTLSMEAVGLFPYVQLLDDESDLETPTYSEEFEIGTELAHRFRLDAADDTADLDLYVYRIGEDGEPLATYVGGTASADETVMLQDPEPGTYVAEVDVYSLPAGADTVAFTLDHAAVVAPDEADATPAAVDAPAAAPAAGTFAIDPASVETAIAEDTTLTASWTGLEAETDYLGVVLYSTSPARTFVQVAVGEAAPPPTTAPPTTAPPTTAPPTTAPPTEPGPSTPPGAGGGNLPTTGGSPLVWLAILAGAIVAVGAAIRIRRS